MTGTYLIHLKRIKELLDFGGIENEDVKMTQEPPTISFC